jgi:hypothetical protein
MARLSNFRFERGHFLGGSVSAVLIPTSSVPSSALLKFENTELVLYCQQLPSPRPSSSIKEQQQNLIAMDTAKRFLISPRSTHGKGSNYLIGLRGFFVVQSFLFVFLQVFAPSAVAHTPNALHASASTLHKALKFVSILFWNDGIIYSGFILLSARTICLPFMTSGAGSKSSIAGSVFRRGLTLWFPVAVALAVSTIVSHTTGYGHINTFAQKTGNLSIFVPYKVDNALIYFNSVFNLFWVTTKFSDQAGSYAFPGQMMWVINVIYQQRYIPLPTLLDVYS